nr:MAG TPA: hypothetical protein [Caudoviricetes sp.]
MIPVVTVQVWRWQLPPFLQQDAIAMTSCCKPCDTQPWTAFSIIPVSPGSSGHFFAW